MTLLGLLAIAIHAGHVEAAASSTEQECGAIEEADVAGQAGCTSRRAVEAVALIQRKIGTVKSKRPLQFMSGKEGAESQSRQEMQSTTVHTAYMLAEAKSALRVASLDAQEVVTLAAQEVLRHAVPRHRVLQNPLNSVAVEVEYHGLLEEVITFPERRPWAFNLIMATLKTTVADMIVQAGEKRSGHSFPGINWRRTLFFAVFGLLYIGMVQWFFYVNLFSILCPDALTFANQPLASKLSDRVGQFDLLMQVLVDQLVINPFFYFPTFYVVKEVFITGNLGPSSFWSALSTYKDNFTQDNLASVSLWFPADFVIFTVPMFLRMPLEHAVSFAWTMIISHMRGGSLPTSAPK